MEKNVVTVTPFRKRLHVKWNKKFTDTLIWDVSWDTVLCYISCWLYRHLRDGANEAGDSVCIWIVMFCISMEGGCSLEEEMSSIYTKHHPLAEPAHLRLYIQQVTSFLIHTRIPYRLEKNGDPFCSLITFSIFILYTF